jgi:hypothetical protein
MLFEKVHMVWDPYDGVRSGVADFGGQPHYFACLLHERGGCYTDRFQLFPVDTEFMVQALRNWKIYRTWESEFHRGNVPLETHPGHGGISTDYDESKQWLDQRVKQLHALPTRQSATFRAIPVQDELPAVREIEVSWSPLSA